MEFLTSGKASVQVWSTAALEGPDAAGEPIVSLPPVLDPLDREHPNARWSPDRRMLGLLQMDGRVHLYDAQKGYAATRTFPPPAEEAEEKGSVRYFCFSPQGSFLVTWERYEVNQEKPVPNLTVWSVDTGDKLVAFIQKQHRVGILQWCADESMMFRRVTNELHCYPGKPKTPEPLRKVRVDDIAEYSVSPAGRTAVFFVPEKKGRPAIVKVVNLDSIDTTVAQKTFFQCQEVTFHWSPRGQGVCVTAACATDAQNTTYYGTSALHFLRTDGKTESTLVTPDLGPVHDVQWNPQGTGFVAVYGTLPATVEAYDDKGNAEMKYGKVRRNTCLWDPFGQIFALGGFGNLPGDTDVWQKGQTRPVAPTFTASCSVEHSWGPDGQSFMSAICAPRMRVDNKVEMFSYDGTKKFELPIELLTHAEWRPVPLSKFEKPKIIQKAGVSAPKAPALYRPGGGKGGSLAAQLRQEKQVETFAQATRVQSMPVGMAPADEPKKAGNSRNERKKLAKERAAKEEEAKPAFAPPNRANESADPAAQKASQPAPVAPVEQPAAADAIVDVEKQIKKLQKKLKSIQELKEKDKSTLDADQKAKLASEAEVLAEIQKLEAEPATAPAPAPKAAAAAPKAAAPAPKAEASPKTSAKATPTATPKATPKTGPAPPPASPVPAVDDEALGKQRKKLEKKLKQIEDLMKKDPGTLDADQKAKVATFEATKAELAALG